MEPSTPSSDAQSLEERLARLEQAGAPRASAVDRLLRYLPILALGNLFLAGPAMVVSSAVAYFTFVQAEATRKMQIAEVWPQVAYNNYNVHDEDGERVDISLANKGLGPARIEGLQIQYRGRAYPDARSLLAACCGLGEERIALGMASLRGDVLRPGPGRR